jgi:hypothetical protein
LAAVNAAYTEISRLESLGDWESDGGAGVADDAEWSALADLVEASPTTLAGIIASMTHIGEMVEEFGRIAGQRSFIERRCKPANFSLASTGKETRPPPSGRVAGPASLPTPDGECSGYS